MASRFYSPLVKSIAKKENIAQAELDSIPGTGALKVVLPKVTLCNYVANQRNCSFRIKHPGSDNPGYPIKRNKSIRIRTKSRSTCCSGQVSQDGNVEIIEMDRMRKLIADHMVMSKHTSPHVTSFVEADVTNIVNWRNSVKKDFQNISTVRKSLLRPSLSKPSRRQSRIFR